MSRDWRVFVVGRRKRDAVADSLRYHEANLPRLINERDTAQDRMGPGEKVHPSYYERVENDIEGVERTIFNLRDHGTVY